MHYFILLIPFFVGYIAYRQMISNNSTDVKVLVIASNMDLGLITMFYMGGVI